MIALPAGVRILLATKPVDFRRGAHALAALAAAELTLRQTRRDEDAAAAALERQAQQRKALNARADELAPVLAAATAAVDEAAATLAALPADDLLAGVARPCQRTSNSDH